jgi:lipopolysaccharide transport system ATP-binding protein
MDSVSKRFRRGEIYDSLRDLVPALAARMLRRGESDKRHFWALQDVSFEVMQGEAFGIIGHNGAGKSTMLKILSRIMRPTKGTMTVHGRLSALIEVSAGFHQDLTGRENIYLNGTILGMSRKEVASKLEAIVEFSGLHEFIDTPVKRYSSGMFARLGFSVAAHVDPDVLIVDEVLSVGDFVFQQKCISRMNEIIRSGTTVLFVSHNLNAVSNLCQRSLLLDHGRIVSIGETQSVIADYMDSIRTRRDPSAQKGVFLETARIIGGSDRSVRFETGDRIRIDVKARAKTRSENVAVVIWFMDSNHYTIFDTSSERLGTEPKSLEAGEGLQCTFELELNMAPGTYHLCVALHRYDLNSTYDSMEPAATFFIGPQKIGFRGVVDCRAKLVEQTKQVPGP